MIQFIREIMTKYKKRYLIGCVLIIVSFILQLFIPFYTQKIIDLLTTQLFSENSFYEITIILVCAPVLAYLISLVWAMMIFFTAHLIEYDIRNASMKQILSQFPNFYQKYTSGTLMSRMFDNLDSYQMFAGYGIMAAFQGFVYPIFIIGLMIYTTNLTLTALTLLPMIILAIGNRFVGKYFEALDEKTVIGMNKMNDAVLNYANGLLTIRSYHLTETAKQAYLDAIEYYRSAVDGFYRSVSAYQILGTFLPAVSTVIALIAGYYFISIQQLTVGSVVAFMLLVRYLETPMRSLPEFLNHYTSAKVGKKLVDEVLSEPRLIQDGSLTLETLNTIQFNHFSYSVGEMNILKDINLEIKQGDFIGVVGKTGSGKSTLLKQLLRHNPIEKGTLLINEVPIEDYTLKSLRKHISYVAQEHTLFSKSIKENIEFGIPIENLDQILNQADLKKDVDMFELKEQTMIGEKGVMLSGGQKQRISLARALHKNGDVFILDDCLSALDNATQENILSFLQTQLDQKTLLVASHRLSIFTNATQIIVLDQGHIVERGTHEELMALKGWYAQQYLYQEKGEVYE